RGDDDRPAPHRGRRSRGVPPPLRCPRRWRVPAARRSRRRRAARADADAPAPHRARLALRRYGCGPPALAPSRPTFQLRTTNSIVDCMFVTHFSVCYPGLHLKVSLPMHALTRSALVLLLGIAVAGSLGTTREGTSTSTNDLDTQLRSTLAGAGFTGRIASTLEQRLGRPGDRRLAHLGQLLWFDPIHALHGDNSCGGCHAPATGFGDSQSIAIGVQSNRIVGPHRTGPRNQRRTPFALNAAFFPALMWNGRFA